MTEISPSNLSNSTSQDSSDMTPSPLLMTILVLWSLALLLSNAGALVAVVSKADLRRCAPGLFAASCLLSGLLVLLVSFPADLVALSGAEVSQGLCAASQWAWLKALGVTAHTLAVATVHERLRAGGGQGLSFAKAAALILAVWLLCSAAAVWAPVMASVHRSKCSLDTKALSAGIVNAIVFFLLPMLVVAATSLNSLTAKPPGEGTASAPLRVAALLFAVLHTPYVVAGLVDLAGGELSLELLLSLKVVAGTHYWLSVLLVLWLCPELRAGGDGVTSMTGTDRLDPEAIKRRNERRTSNLDLSDFAL